jgi:Delta7-sterol 5-desaturase
VIRLAPLTTAIVLSLMAIRPAAAEDSALGRWLTPGASAVVELAPCADGSTLCGTIRWLWDATDDKGRPRLDSQNTDASQRARPLLGLAILSGLAPKHGGGWQGRIYNPEDGQTYRATVSRRGADTLVVEGCVLFVCQKQVWRKASSLAEALR